MDLSYRSRIWSLTKQNWHHLLSKAPWQWPVVHAMSTCKSPEPNNQKAIDFLNVKICSPGVCREPTLCNDLIITALWWSVLFPKHVLGAVWQCQSNREETVTPLSHKLPECKKSLDLQTWSFADENLTDKAHPGMQLTIAVWFVKLFVTHTDVPLSSCKSFQWANNKKNPHPYKKPTPK